MTKVSEIEEAVNKIIMENSNQGKETQIGEIGSKLNLLYPDFDVRNYGYSKLTTFLKESCSSVVFSMRHNQVVLTLNDKPEDILSIVTMVLKENGGQVDNMGRVSAEIKKINPGFNVKNYGYSKFGKFVTSLPGIEQTGPNGLRLVEKKAKRKQT